MFSGERAAGCLLLVLRRKNKFFSGGAASCSPTKQINRCCCLFSGEKTQKVSSTAAHFQIFRFLLLLTSDFYRLFSGEKNSLPISTKKPKTDSKTDNRTENRFKNRKPKAESRKTEWFWFWFSKNRIFRFGFGFTPKPNQTEPNRTEHTPKRHHTFTYRVKLSVNELYGN